MRQVFLQKGAVVVKEVSQPRLDEYSVLVCVHYSFISSGTELATIQNAQAGMFANIPSKIKNVFATVSTHGVDGTAALIRETLQGSFHSLGYSVSGQVIAVGSKVRRFRTGDYVACAGAGYANHADLVCVPENLTVKINKKEDVRAASITTLGASALQGVRRAQVELGERVCVIGLGLLGQLTVQLAHASGCAVIGIDLIPERCELATKLGAQHVFSPSLNSSGQATGANGEGVIEEINLITEHYGVDATIITATSKSNELINQAIAMTRRKGRVVVVGDVGLDLNAEEFYKKEIDLRMSSVQQTETRNMQAFVEMIEHKRISIEPLICAEVDLDHIEQAYQQLTSKHMLGVVLRYGPNEQVAQQAVTQSKAVLEYQEKIRFSPAVIDSIRVGIVGAGGFAKIKLMPVVSKLKNTKISAIVDANMANSMNVSKIYGAAKALAHDDELFATDLVDAVVISSPHKFHCDQALKALGHGKAVFVEKPMVTDFEQLARMQEFFRKNPNMPFCVDYNRSFAPFMLKIKTQLAKRKTPLVAHYRMNAGRIDKDNWVQTQVGAGRIIGEACHILDLFCFLTDANPVAVSVESLHAQRTDIFPTDNFTAQISFDDGSICSLLYTALGHASLGKERMELFFDGKSIVMEEYTQLYGFGISSSFNETVSTPDKGHEGLLKSFFKGLHKKTDQSPIPFSRLFKVAELSLIIDQLACEGGGSKEL